MGNGTVLHSNAQGRYVFGIIHECFGKINPIIATYVFYIVDMIHPKTGRLQGVFCRGIITKEVRA